ncbi:phosphopantetheine-binding protein [Schaalia odontolytica]|uniref:phosphopantetheine-binding protein n=1 Tax=Schaalia odontolytica TaxID=1660 RepID=UPI00210E1B8B|nr:acyl carrier protein [Schaalia odontolytica]MCQ5281546.1 acyl carrier protein [Schaalia odontolytica]
MGSIADLLGDQLRAGLAQLVDPDASDEAPDGASASDLERASDACERARVIAMEAVLDEVEVDPALVRGQDTLREDLDMDDVSLYAVVARVEREAKVTLNDSKIEQWLTLADLLDAVSDAVSNH